MINNNIGLVMQKKSIDLIEYTGRTPIKTQLEIAYRKQLLANSQYQKSLCIRAQLSTVACGVDVFDKDLNDVLARLECLYKAQIDGCKKVIHACTNNIIRGPYLPQYIVEKNIGYQQVIYAYNRISAVYDSALLVVRGR